MKPAELAPKTHAGVVIATELKRRGMSLAHLAESMGVHRNTAYRWMDHELPLYASRAIAALLHIDIKVLFRAMAEDHYEYLCEWLVGQDKPLLVAKPEGRKRKAKPEQESLEF